MKYEWVCCGIVLGRDWRKSKPCSKLRELQLFVSVRFSHSDHQRCHCTHLQPRWRKFLKSPRVWASHVTLVNYFPVCGLLALLLRISTEAIVCCFGLEAQDLPLLVDPEREGRHGRPDEDPAMMMLVNTDDVAANRPVWPLIELSFSHGELRLLWHIKTDVDFIEDFPLNKFMRVSAIIQISEVHFSPLYIKSGMWVAWIIRIEINHKKSGGQQGSYIYIAKIGDLSGIYHLHFQNCVFKHWANHEK